MKKILLSLILGLVGGSYATVAFAMPSMDGSGSHENCQTRHQQSLGAEQRTFLAQYEEVRAALSVDDLVAAKSAAGKIADNRAATMIAKSSSISEAREVFAALSTDAVKLARGQSGYFVMHCPMVTDGYWVQNRSEVSNPYLGKSDSSCGSVVE